MNREEWLNKAVKELKHTLFINYDMTDNWRVSCGFPSKGAMAKKKRAMGECWSDLNSESGHYEVFISPVLSLASDVLPVLVHEFVHVIAGIEAGHKGQFRKIAMDVGLQPPMTSTTPDEFLVAFLRDLAMKLGDYPHAKLDSLSNGQKKDGTRMLKLECENCGYTVRTTKKWLDVGLPTCVCGTEFKAPDTGETPEDPEGDDND